MKLMKPVRRLDVAEQIRDLVVELRSLIGLARTALAKRVKYATKQELQELENKIMPTVKELTEELQQVSRSQKKTYEEIKSVQLAHQLKLKELEDLIAGMGNDADPDLVAVVAELKKQADMTDDLIPDTTQPSH